MLKAFSHESTLLQPDSMMKPTVLQTYIPDVPSIEIDISAVKRDSDVDLRVLIMTYNRPLSLTRLLNSLNEAEYYGDKIVIEIWIDKSKDGVINKETFQAANNFVFKKGQKIVANHTKHVGLYGQWMGLWQPQSETKDIVVIFEDDTTVSPFFYRYLKNIHAKYRDRSDINSYAMQCSGKHVNAGGQLHAPDEHIVFLYPILGTCGFSPQNKNWINFRKWYIKITNSQHFDPFVPGILPTQWYMEHIKSGRTEDMWEMWHIYYAYNHNESTLYPNLLNCEGLTLNWKEFGLHFKEKITITDRLLTKWDNRLDNLPDKPIYLDVYSRVKRP